MRTYRLIAQPNVRFPAAVNVSALNEDLLIAELAGLVVRELSEDEWGRIVLEVRLQRPTDDGALEEIVAVLWRLGFVVARATVNEWVGEVVERAVLGALGGGALGSTTKNALAAVIASIAGALVLGISGTEVSRLKAQYEARRDAVGVWSFQQVGRPAGSDVGFAAA